MPKKSGFTLIELLIVIVILGILATIGLASFTSSQMKSRDAKRKSDLRQIASALELYNNDKGQYPASGMGRIVGCGPGANTTVCVWGDLNNMFSNTTTGTIYMAKLPADPSSYYYYYVSTGTTYKLYARLENTQDKSIISTAVSCGGTGNCNFGISSSNSTP